MPRMYSFLSLLTFALSGVAVGEDATSDGAAAVSYADQIRPIFQAQCHGCHQPAKANGQYVMTAFDRLVRGGESETAAIVAGAPDESYLLDLITPTDGMAEMPQGKSPLSADEIELIRKWIAGGALDDTPTDTRKRYDQDHLPIYRRPPVITSLDYSPDGSLLAVAGFHEVLLLRADGSETVARLVGMSERIETVRFSPDGERLLATGGLPGRMGEVQVWDVANRELLLSRPITYDTVYGGNWSPDGKHIAFGCADKSVRAIDAATGEEVVYMAAHDDLVRDTVFNANGESVFSVSRDKTVKMTDLSTQRFVGNVTTHTPGILLGGMNAIARHPTREELLVGGADGAPKLFRMDVKAAPAKGGNPNQVREYDRMQGRVFDVCFQPQGGLVFGGSSLNGAGQVRGFETDSGKQSWNLDLPETGIFSLACSPDGKSLAAAGADGTIRLIDTATGMLRHSILPEGFRVDAPDNGTVLSAATVTPDSSLRPTPIDASEDAPLTNTAQVTSLTVDPQQLVIASPLDYAQLLLTASLSDGTQADVTRAATWQIEGAVGSISATGMFQPQRNGDGKIVAQFAGQRVEVPVKVRGLDTVFEPDYIRDVNPVITRLGCNAGTCHGAAKGKNGFKLSLRGYDAISDIRSLSDDLASRRVNVVSPADSLMLLKTTSTVPHQGGQLMKPGDRYHALIRDWIGAGAQLELDSPRVDKIEVRPDNPVIQQVGQRQQMRVIVTYTDGTTRDVTREAFIDSGNSEVSTADRGGLMTAVRRGEAPVLARYEGAYAATTLTVMGDRSEFVWEQPETPSRIDELVAAKWQRMKIRPSAACSDADFLRRVYLDLTGLPPTAEEVRKFLDDSRDQKIKRNELIDLLIGSEDFVDHWTNKWADLLQVNRKHLGPQGAAAFRAWIRDEVSANTPYDEFAHKILTASGSNRENPAASYYKILRDPLDTMENTTQLFMAVRFNCNKCHDHPFERWTQDQYYQTAAYFAHLDLKRDPASEKNTIGGTAVEGAKPLYEIVSDKEEGDVVHDRTKEVAAPKFPFECNYHAPDESTRRQELAAWITSPDNQYFARSYVNRLWGYLLGTGLIEPLDDIRAGNPATNPELLDYLAEEFIDSGFDVRHMLQMIGRSRTYQLSIETNRWNHDDSINYSHAIARRLPAEVLYDSIHRAVGSESRIAGVAAGTRAAALTDSGVNLPDGFLANLGRPARESSCECERSSSLQLGPVMALISGPTVGQALADPNNAITKLAATAEDDAELIDTMLLRILNRPATSAEIDSISAALRELPAEHDSLVARLHAYELELAPKIVQQEQARLQAMATAETELAAYEKEVGPREAKLEQARQQRISQANAQVKSFEKQLPAKLAAWEQDVQRPIAWTTLDAFELSSTNQATLTKQDDLSVLASGSNGKTTYKFVARTDLQAVTGVKLELYADDRFPSKGPGRSPNGNFVLTEFRSQWAPDGKPDQLTSVVLQNAQANFSQDGYSVQTAIDGKKSPQGNGWASSPKLGENRIAVFETKSDVDSEFGRLTFFLDQEYQDGQHTIGRFAISVTTAPRPITLDGLPKNISDILAVATGQRNGKQKAELMKYYRGVNAELKKLDQAAVEAKKPRPIDPKLTQLRDKLAEVTKVAPPDPTLTELRNAVQMSDQQLKTARLTFAQDLAWALINSPAFLFNH